MRQKANLNIIFTGNWIKGNVDNLLKPYDLSHQQFNVLRILRGKYPEHANLQDITERMIDKMSNATRLVEKLRLKGFVTRDICVENRRKVEICITQAGLDMLKVLDPVIENTNKEVLSRISEEEAQVLSDLLDKLRG